MKGIMAAIFMLCCLSTHAQAEQDLDGFQGLKWGETIESIQSKFPLAYMETSLCNMLPDQHIQLMAERDDINCAYLSMDKYKVGEYDFKVEFGLTSDKKLKLVSLHLIDNKSFNHNDKILSDIFLALNEYLAIKYGMSTDVSTIDKGPNTLKMKTNNWKSDTTHLYLRSTFTPLDYAMDSSLDITYYTRGNRASNAL